MAYTVHYKNKTTQFYHLAQCNIVKGIPNSLIRCKERA